MTMPAGVTDAEALELGPLQAFLYERMARGPMVERALVAGSRNWTRARILRLAVQMLPATATLVEGDAAGADRLAGQVWTWLGGAVEAHPLPEKWWLAGRRIPFERNQRMVDRGADVGLFFHRGNSGGTAHCLRAAQAAGIPVFVFTQEGPPDGQVDQHGGHRRGRPAQLP